MGISIRAYARARGCAESGVRKAIATKRITLNADGTIDPARANEEWARNTFSNKTLRQEEPQAPELQGGTDLGAAYRNARVADAVYLAKWRRLRYEKEAGTLIQSTQAGEYAVQWAAIVGEALSAFADRLTPLVAAAKSEPEIHRIIDGEAAVLRRKMAKAISDAGF